MTIDQNPDQYPDQAPDFENPWIHLSLEQINSEATDTGEFNVTAESHGIADGEAGLLRVLKSLVATLEAKQSMDTNQ